MPSPLETKWCYIPIARVANPGNFKIQGQRRGSLPQTLTGPLEVMVAAVAVKARSRLMAISMISEVNAFVVHASPQWLDEDVVVGTAPAVHTDQPSSFCKSGGEGNGRNLRPLVSVEYLRKAARHCLRQAVQAKLAVQSIRNFPGHDVAGEPVHDCREVHEPLSHPDLCSVGAPKPVGMTDMDFPEQIGIGLASTDR